MSTKDWIEKDYYKILGVSKNADQAEIKKAYRTLARELHPDRNANDKATEMRFKEVSEANAVLSDPDKRKQYDDARSLFGSGGRVPTGSGTGSGVASPSTWATCSVAVAAAAVAWVTSSAASSVSGPGRARRPLAVAPTWRPR